MLTPKDQQDSNEDPGKLWSRGAGVTEEYLQVAPPEVAETGAQEKS